MINKNKALVSIIIPFYNRFDLLENTLKSVASQTYKNFEIILVDDCSDLTPPLKEYKNLFEFQSLNYYRLNKNSGPGAARKFGRKKAIGKYITYLDSDDEWHKKFLEITVKYINLNSGISMVFTNVLVKRNWSTNTRLSLERGTYNFFDLIFKRKIYWATGAALWRNTITLADNWKNIRDHEDYTHDVLSLVKAPQIYYVEEPLVIVNKNPKRGIKRSSSQMINAFLIMLNHSTVIGYLRETKQVNDFLDFIYIRLKKRKFNILDISEIIKLYISIIHLSERRIFDLKRFSKLIIRKIAV